MSSLNFTSLCPPMMTYFLHTPRNLFYDNYLLAVITLNTIISLAATCSNLLVIVTFCKTPSLQTPSNFLILGLAVADFGTGAITLPAYCLYKLSEYLRLVTLFCSSGKVYTVCGISLSMISFTTLSAITVDRFLAVHLHLRYEHYVTTKRYAFLLIFCWCLCIFAVICRFELYHVVSLITGVVLFLIILAFDAFFIFKIAKVIKNHSVQIQAQMNQSREQPLDMARFKKTVTVMYSIIGVFVLCYLPLALVLIGLIAIHGDVFKIQMRISFTIAELFLMSNSALNPIIYCWRMKEIRVACKKLLPRIFYKIHVAE